MRRSGGEPPTPYSVPIGSWAALNIQTFQMVVSPVPGEGSASARSSRLAASAVRNVVRDTRALVYATVPVVRAAAGVDVELPAHAVQSPLVVAVLVLENRVDARALQEDVGDEQSAEMRRVRDAARVAERRHERDRPHDCDEDFRRNRE